MPRLPLVFATLAVMFAVLAVSDPGSQTLHAITAAAFTVTALAAHRARKDNR